MNKESIEAIWLGRPIKSYASKEDEAIIAERLTRLRDLHSIIADGLDSQGKKDFNDYLNCQSVISDLEKKNAFIDGFSLGIRLVVEGLNR